MKLIGYVLGIFVCLAVLGVFKDDPADNNTIRDSVGMMWLQKEVDSCLRVKEAAGDKWTPKHFKWNECVEFYANKDIPIEEKIRVAKVWNKR